MLFLAGDCLAGVAPFAGGFVGFDAGVVRGVIHDVHRSAAARLGARDVFMLKGLHKPAMGLTLLVGFHRLLLGSSHLRGWG